MEAPLTDLGMLELDGESKAKFSPDGRHIVVARDRDTVVFDSVSCAQICQVDRGPSPHFGFAGNDAFYTMRDSEAPLELFDLKGKRLKVVPTGALVSAVMSNDLAITQEAGDKTMLWSLRTPAQIRTLHAEGATRPPAAAMSDDGFIAAIATGQNTVLLKETENGHLLRTLDIGGKGRLLYFSHDADWLCVVTSDSKVQFWHLSGEETPSRIDCPRIGHFAFSRKGELAVMTLPDTHQVELLQRKEGKWQSQVVSVSGNIRSIEIAFDASRFVLVDDRNNGQLLSVGENASLTGPMESAPAKGLGNTRGELFLSNNTTLRNVVEWNLTTGAQVGVLPATSGLVLDVTTCDAGIGAAIDSKYVYIIDLRTCQILKQLPSPMSAPLDVHLSADGSRLLLSSVVDGVMLLDLSIPARIRALPAASDTTPVIWAQLRSLSAAGLKDLVSPAYLQFRDEILESPLVIDGFAFWDSGNTSAAAKVFQESTELSPGSRAMIARQLPPPTPRRDASKTNGRAH